MSRITPTTAPAQIEHYILPCEGFVRLTGVLAVFPVSRSHFLAGVRQGRYPRPVRLSESIVGWRVEDIRDLIARTIAAESEAAGELPRRGPGRPRKTPTHSLHIAEPIAQPMVAKQADRFFSSHK